MGGRGLVSSLVHAREREILLTGKKGGSVEPSQNRSGPSGKTKVTERTNNDV